MKNEMREIISRKKIITTILIGGLILIITGAILISITESTLVYVEVENVYHPIIITERPFIEQGWNLVFAGLFIMTGWILWAVYKKDQLKGHSLNYSFISSRNEKFI